jgi:mannose-1-phosphate guanylyltransferase
VRLRQCTKSWHASGNKENVICQKTQGIEKMKAMILAAGKGTRINPISQTIPKPLIPIMNKPVVQLLVEYLAKNGIKDIAINTSHLAEKIEHACQHGSQFGVDILYSYEGTKVGNDFHPQTIGSAGGLKRVQDRWNYFDGTFVVMCGDAYLDLDLNAALKAHYRNRAIATVVLKDVEPQACEKYGVVKCNNKGRVESFQEKPLPEEALSNTVNTGVYIFEPEIFEHIPEARGYDIGSQLLPDLVSKGLPFYGFKADFNWLDIGSIQDIWQANTRLVKGEMNDFKIPGTRNFFSLRAESSVVIDPHNSIIRGPIYIGSGTIVEPGATIIGPTVIGSNCEIRANAVIRESVIGDHYRIENSCTLNRELVLAGYRLDLEGHNTPIDDCYPHITDARSCQNNDLITESFTTNLIPSPRTKQASL